MPIYKIKCSNCNEIFSKYHKSVSDLEKELKDKECEICKSVCLTLHTHSLSTLRTGQAKKDKMMKERFKKRNKNLEKLPEENKQRMAKFMHDYNVKKEQ